MGALIGFEIKRKESIGSDKKGVRRDCEAGRGLVRAGVNVHWRQIPFEGGVGIIIEFKKSRHAGVPRIGRKMVVHRLVAPDRRIGHSHRQAVALEGRQQVAVKPGGLQQGIQADLGEGGHLAALQRKLGGDVQAVDEALLPVGQGIPVVEIHPQDVDIIVARIDLEIAVARSEADR
ncbi:MAG: hypothetical protein BWY77_01876 [bacterium ADurb.Bin431]|nr:MAG: hypothetical protein BWY77_01876 [bacterium ADurb.Bin431]